MSLIKVSKGTCFVQQGTKMKELYLVVQGKVRQTHRADSYLLETGNLIGIAECQSGIYQNYYTAEEDCALYTFPYENPRDFRTIFESQPKYAVAFLQAALKQTLAILEQYQAQKQKAESYYTFLVQTYRQYCQFCEEYGLPEKMPYRMENLARPQIEGMLEDWDVAFYQELLASLSSGLGQYYSKSHTLVIGEILHTAGALSAALDQMDKMRDYLTDNQEILLRIKKSDMFELYQELAAAAVSNGCSTDGIFAVVGKMKEYIKSSGIYDEKLVDWRFDEFDRCDFEALAKEQPKEPNRDVKLQGSLDQILAYANCEEAQILRVKELLPAYRRMEKDSSIDDAARRIRRELTAIFFDIYKKVFRRTLSDEEIPPVIQMFLMFGYLDEETAGVENAQRLYSLIEMLDLCRGEHIYTIYDWLHAIYFGLQEPSKNEFDLDYGGYLHEQRRMGHLTEEQVIKLRADNWEKVVFEISNMFASANRATYGKFSTYCPVLSSADMGGAIQNMLVTASKLQKAQNAIRKIDFSLFYHEVIFSDPMHGVNKEMIQKEILPDIILMPNIGTKAMMWQETAGLKRDTSARFVFPIMTTESIEDMMVATCGRYRWEICRKIQGMRWNDITERSLTSEYCDYIQFYKKNQALSPETKEKIKNALVRAKNNYREVFVMDYIAWIRYESNGSFRLNRVARDIMFRYCPFCKNIRQLLEDNPMYQDIFPKYRIQTERQLRRTRGFIDKYLKSGGTMTSDLIEALEFFDK